MNYVVNLVIISRKLTVIVFNLSFFFLFKTEQILYKLDLKLSSLNGCVMFIMLLTEGKNHACTTLAKSSLMGF